MSQVLDGACLVTPGELIPDGWLEIDGGVIVGLGAGTPPRPSDVTLDGGYLSPGFIDIHSHGGGGASVIGADPDSVVRFARAHLEHGTTTIVASLVSAHPDSLAHDVAALADMAEQGIIAGTHLEGPWIAPQYAGAHDPLTLRDPDPVEVARIIELGRGTIAMVTIAPELPHGLHAIHQFVESGAIAAIGHTNAAYDEVRAAIDAGANVATHLFNAMRPGDHRDPGPVVALTEDPGVTNELILDGVHIHPATAAFAARAAEGRVVLVTDAMSAAAGRDGRYQLGGLPVRVVDGVARLVNGGAIAGSTLTMDAAVRYAIRSVGLSPKDAFAAATSTPARLLGLPDRGALEVGRRADLCHMDADLRVTAVWVAGEAVDRQLTTPDHGPLPGDR